MIVHNVFLTSWIFIYESKVFYREHDPMLILKNHSSCWKVKVKFTQSCPTLCDPMHCQNTGVGSLSLLQGSSQSRDRTQVSRIVGGFLTSWATREAQEYWNGQPIPSLGDLPDPGIEPGSWALKADSLPTELPAKPNWVIRESNHWVFGQLPVSSVSKLPWCFTQLQGSNWKMAFRKFI